MSARPVSGVKEDNRETAPLTMSRRPVPMSGDVLVSRPTARAGLYAISVVPTPGDVLAIRYAKAIEKAREFARGLAVDGWYTADHIHFVRIASYRT